MAGEAQTTNFMLGTATVMVGPMASVFDLIPSANSLGLAKNVKVTGDPAFKELTQGVQQQAIFSVKTGNAVKAMFDAYEFTMRNLTYANGLDGGVNAAPVIAETTASAATTSGAATMTVVSATGLAANQWVIIEDPVFPDKNYIRQILSIAALVVTFKTNLPAVVLPIGTILRTVSTLDIGNTLTQPFLGCKIVGLTAENKSVSVILPKVKIVSGFNLGFTTDDYSSMPFEIQAYNLVPADALYSSFATKMGGIYAN